jgi:Na+/H+ antiporter NhaD/arsenite permease-like protein
MVWLAVAVFVVVYILIASERINRVAAALAGAALVLAFNVVGASDAFFSEQTGSTGTSSSCCSG